jgi:thioesterase domain-containing protein/acyl carrier protein
MHAAGVADGKLIALRTAADDARILAPKLDGTANLLGLLRGRDVGRVILFSSVTALTAEPGQFAYAAANAYLDACAESERELNVLSIAWDTFAEVGMACDAPLPAALADERARRLALGLRNDEAFAVLVRALGYPGRRLIVSTRELTTRLRALEAGPATTKVELSRDRLRDELLALWRESFGVPDLDAETDFFDAGGSSLQAVQLAHRVRERLGVALAPDALLHHATVDALADFLSRPDEPAAAEETLVCLQAGDAALAPLFLLHPVGGEVFVYQELVKQLGTEHPVYGLRQAVAQVGLSVPELARQHRARIERVYDGPYHLAGSSFGGTLALEIARCRAEEGRAVASLTLIDTPSGELLTHRLESERDVLLYLAADLPAGSKLSERALAAVDDAELFDYFAREASTQLRGAALGPELLRRYVSALRSNDAAMRAYALPTYAGPLLYIKAISRRPIYDPARPELPFKLRYPQLVSVAVEGNHVTMHAPPHVNALARALRTQLHPTARDADRYETGGTR